MSDVGQNPLWALERTSASPCSVITQYLSKFSERQCAYAYLWCWALACIKFWLWLIIASHMGSLCSVLLTKTRSLSLSCYLQNPICAKHLCVWETWLQPPVVVVAEGRGIAGGISMAGMQTTPDWTVGLWFLSYSRATPMLEMFHHTVLVSILIVPISASHSQLGFPKTGLEAKISMLFS